MACPFCNVTMTNLGIDGGGRRVFWCARCGTIKTETADFTEFEAPRWARLAREDRIADLTREAWAVQPNTDSEGG